MEVKYFQDEEKGITVCKVTINILNFDLSGAKKLLKKMNLQEDMDILYGVEAILRRSVERRYQDIFHDHELTFTGIARLHPSDDFIPEYGKRLAYKKAMKRYHKAMARAYEDSMLVFEEMRVLTKALAGDERMEAGV